MSKAGKNTPKPKAGNQFVDVKSTDFDFTRARLYERIGISKRNVVIAKRKEEVKTIIDGFVETTNTAKPGDYIITGPKGERYILTAENFHKQYRENPKNKNEYSSIAKIRAIKLERPTRIMAPWGAHQSVLRGYIAQKETDKKDVYLIEESAFNKTYKLS